MKHIVRSQVMKNLEFHGILTDSQHGFRKRRSCESQLILAIQDIAYSLGEGDNIDAVLLDLCKLFDKDKSKGTHNRLTVKLDRYGINNN